MRNYPALLIACLALAVLAAAGCKKETAKCGNGVLEGDEVCDGNDFGDDNCQHHGYLSGLLGCTIACDGMLYDNCVGGCGNGSIDEGEECDGYDFMGDNCQMHGFDYGTLTCTAACTKDTGGCINAVCGNGEIEETEECEPDVALTQDCEDFLFNAGTLACFASGTETECHYDTSGCVNWVCGNGVIDPGENCDFDTAGNELLDDRTCDTEGYDTGELHCVPADSDQIASRCKFDVSGCSDFVCGNGTLEGDEACEEGVAITATCEEQGFTGGTLACKTDDTCTFDLSGCTGGCGNDLLEGEEECDGEDLGDQTCESVSTGTLTGELRCRPDCTFDMTLCVPV